MSEEKPKYFVIKVLLETLKSGAFFQTQIDDAVTDGYRVHTFTSQYEESECQGIGYTRYIALMSLSEPTKYDDIEKYKKLPITEQEGTIPRGWKVIHHTSKEFIIVKKHERTNTDVQE